ncbi:MAG: FAD-dependent oxidoreductase [Deltaproteobacteria bacterium]|nr:MAG: FAD-dependent oxidoreductase [Deltaproteobacteria bacterium]
MEKEYALTPVERRKSVLVIGGGPGGMEAAWVAASRGCDVTLWERSDRLGGKLHVASTPEFKRDIRPLIDYLVRQVERTGVRVELGKTATVEEIRQRRDDVVLIATGSRFAMPPVEGVDLPHVINTVELYTGNKTVGDRVLVVGGGLCGCEAAAYLAELGKQVTVIEMARDILPEGKTVNTRLAIRALIEKSGVAVRTSTKLVAVTPSGARVEHNGEEQEIEADTVVIATGFSPDVSLRDALEEELPEVVAIGDCAQPRTIAEAIWSGFHAARVIE